MQKDNILEVKNLSVSFGLEKIFDNFSFAVGRGEFLTILGPNGSGKTVLLKALLSLLDDARVSGEVSWGSNAKIGYLPQGLTHLKVKDLPLSVAEFLALKNISKQRAIELFKTVDINDEKILSKQIGTLSGGQFQRMLMVWALANNPNVLLFDEPTTGVDVSGEESIYKLLSKLQKEKHLTIILITHDFNVVSHYSTDVLCVGKGAVCHGKPQEVLVPEKLQELYGSPIKFYHHKH